MITCTFAGHRDVYQSDIEAKLKEEIERLMQTDSEFLFLSGGMGKFDRMGAGAVREAKRSYPNKRISLALVLPYMSSRLNADKDFYQLYYDQIIIPEESAAAYYKEAIQIRNRWMVDQSDTVIACIYRSSGGAFATVRYARRQGKPVVNLAERV